MTHLPSIITGLAFLIGIAATPASEIFKGGDIVWIVGNKDSILNW